MLLFNHLISLLKSQFSLSLNFIHLKSVNQIINPKHQWFYVKILVFGGKTRNFRENYVLLSFRRGFGVWTREFGIQWGGWFRFLGAGFGTR